MKLPIAIKNLRLVLLVIVFITGLSQVFSQTTYYFDTNGATNWFGFTVGGSYTWDTSELWSTSNTGNVATSSWTNGNIAAFRLIDNTGKAFANNQTITVNLAQNVTVAGLSNAQNGLTIIQADEARTITLQPNATIYVTNGGVITSTGIVIGDNVNLSGNFTITSSGAYPGSLRINGAGDTYNGTITINAVSGAGLWLDPDTRISQDVKIVLNSGALHVQGSTIGSLSGSGGYLTSTSAASITIDQSENTTWGGQVATEPAKGFITINKKGSGRLEMTNTDAQHNSSSANWNIEEGSLYVGGQLINYNGTGANARNHNINVSSGATFGGTVDTQRRTILLAADSILDAGYYGAVGTLNLSAGIKATSGGTFHFDLNGGTASRINFANVLLLDGAAGNEFLTLGGTKTINLYNIGDLENIVEHTPYVLMDATASGATWDMTGWTFHLAGDDWGAWKTDTENVIWDLTGDKLTVTFVPEPSTWLLLVSACGLWALGMRRRSFFFF